MSAAKAVWMIFLTLMVGIILITPVHADPETEFADGIQQYRDGDFSGAVETWKSVLSSGVRDERIHYNLGNAYYKLGIPGHAVLHYERARRINPKDKNIRDNLDFVRLQLKDRFPETARGSYAKLLDGLYNLLSIEQLAALFLMLFIGVQVLWTLYLVKKEQGIRTIVTFLGSIVLALLLVVGPLVSVKIYRDHMVQHGVVLQPSVTARSAPQGDATDLFVVHEGTKIRLWEQVGDWQRVSLPNGLTGFLPASSFEEI